MTIRAYAQFVPKTIAYPRERWRDYCFGALVAEAGEVCEVLPKHIRDCGGAGSPRECDHCRDRYIDELGDVLWVIFAISHHCGFAEEVVENLEAFDRGGGFFTELSEGLGAKFESVHQVAMLAAGIAYTIASRQASEDEIPAEDFMMVLDLLGIAAGLLESDLGSIARTNQTKLSGRKEEGSIRASTRWRPLSESMPDPARHKTIVVRGNEQGKTWFKLQQAYSDRAGWLTTKWHTQYTAEAWLCLD